MPDMMLVERLLEERAEFIRANGRPPDRLELGKNEYNELRREIDRRNRYLVRYDPKTEACEILGVPLDRVSDARRIKFV